MDAYENSSSASPSSSASDKSSGSGSGSGDHHQPSGIVTYGSSHSNASRSSSLRDLDELLMGGNDLDALPFELGCDFGAAFEDKFFVPPLSTASATRLAAAGAEPSFDALPPLSLLSPPNANFQFPVPSPFRHFDLERLKVASRCSSAASHAHSEPSSVASSPLKKDDAAASASDGGEDSSAGSGGAPARSGSGAKSTHIGRWTKKEHELFLEGLKLYGKSWKKISSLVVTRTLVQIRTHAQKYLQKQSKNAQKAAAAAAAAAAVAAAPPVGDSTESAMPPAPAKSSRQQTLRPAHTFGDHFDAWRGAPVNFADLLPPTASSAMGGAASLARSVQSSAFLLPALAKRESSATGGSAMSRLEQLLQEEPPHFAPVDAYFPSPMSTDDEMLQHPAYAQWSRADAHGSSSAAPPSSSVLSLPTKRRRLEPSAHGQHALVNPMEAMSSSAVGGHMNMFALGASSSSSSTTTSHNGSSSNGSHSSSNNGLYGAADFAHQQQSGYSAPQAFGESGEYGGYSGSWQSLPH